MVHSMIDHLITILSPIPPQAQNITQARDLIKHAASDTKHLAEELNESIAQYLSLGYEQFETLQSTPPDSPNLDESKQAWSDFQTDTLREATLTFTKIWNHTSSFTPPWTKYEWNSHRISGREGIPSRYGWNLLSRDDLETLDMAYTSTYPEGNQMLSPVTQSAMEKATQYRDKVVDALHKLGQKHMENQDSAVKNAWSSAHIRAHLLLSPLPGHPLPLPLPTSSVQKELWSNLEKYEPVITMVSLCKFSLPNRMVPVGLYTHWDTNWGVRAPTHHCGCCACVVP